MANDYENDAKSFLDGLDSDDSDDSSLLAMLMKLLKLLFKFLFNDSPPNSPPSPEAQKALDDLKTGLNTLEAPGADGEMLREKLGDPREMISKSIDRAKEVKNDDDGSLNNDDYKLFAQSFLNGQLSVNKQMNENKADLLTDIKMAKLQRNISELREQGKFDNREFIKSLHSELKDHFGDEQKANQALEQMITTSTHGNLLNNSGIPAFIKSSTTFQAAQKNCVEFEKAGNEYLSELQAENTATEDFDHSTDGLMIELTNAPPKPSPDDDAEINYERIEAARKEAEQLKEEQMKNSIRSTPNIETIEAREKQIADFVAQNDEEPSAPSTEASCSSSGPSFGP